MRIQFLTRTLPGKSPVDAALGLVEAGWCDASSIHERDGGVLMIQDALLTPRVYRARTVGNLRIIKSRSAIIVLLQQSGSMTNVRALLQGWESYALATLLIAVIIVVILVDVLVRGSGAGFVAAAFLLSVLLGLWMLSVGRWVTRVLQAVRSPNRAIESFK